LGPVVQHRRISDERGRNHMMLATAEDQPIAEICGETVRFKAFFSLTPLARLPRIVCVRGESNMILTSHCAQLLRAELAAAHLSFRTGGFGLRLRILT
jgi:hypothetical protein